MKTRIVSIGNSKGIRIPKHLLEQTGLAGEVEISANKKGLLIQRIKKPRADWASAFQDMSKRGDDAFWDDVPNLSSWDESEWTW
jgi:antitoxin MazE